MQDHEIYDKLKIYSKNIIHLPLTDEELRLIESYFEVKELKKKDFLLREGKVCNLVGFIVKGAIRHFHVKDGVEITCDISLENAWITDYNSITHKTPCIVNLQAMEDTTVLVINKTDLFKLYDECTKFETFGRLMAERIAHRSIEIAMSLLSDKPEERVNNLLNNHPDLFQRIPQKYIANFLGISPESLSRIKRRIHTKRKSQH